MITLDMKKKYPWQLFLTSVTLKSGDVSAHIFHKEEWNEKISYCIAWSFG